MIYRDACACLLEFDHGDKLDDQGPDQLIRGEWIATIRMYEQSIQFTSCLHATRSADAQTLQDEIVNLQRTSFYARYGDFFAITCRKLKQEAEARKVAGWEALQNGYWTEIDRKLELERPAYERVLKGADAHKECPTYIAVSQACTRVGFDLENMLKIIHHYAVRNELMHANLLPMIKHGQFHDLMKRLHDDFCNIPKIVSAPDDVQIDLMIKLLETMINLWFDRDEEEPDNVQMWVPSEKLKKYHKEFRGPNARGDAEVNQEMSDGIVQSIRKRCRGSQKEREIIAMIENNFGLSQEVCKTKRIASSQLAEETVRAQKRNKDWTKIMNMVHGTKKMSDTYLEEYGELGMPPLIVVDPSLPLNRKLKVDLKAFFFCGKFVFICISFSIALYLEARSRTKKNTDISNC